MFFLFPKAIKEVPSLESEFRNITPPESVQLYEYDTFYKATLASVDGEYSTDLNVEEIFAHYDEELARRGWHYLGKHDITVEAVGREYCKGEYTASVSYYGIGYSWDYELHLRWNPYYSCSLAQKKNKLVIP